MSIDGGPIKRFARRENLHDDTEEVYIQSGTKSGDKTLYRFECYRFLDVINFLELLEMEESPAFVYAHKKMSEDSFPLSAGYVIAYWHTEELSMSVMT